jgi:hypothetical protein
MARPKVFRGKMCCIPPLGRILELDKNKVEPNELRDAKPYL